METRASKETVNVAVVNFHSIWGDKEATLRKIESYVRKAAEKQANIVVFPELALTGYDVEPEAKMHERAAETVPGPSTERVAQLANKHNIYVIFGMPERDRNDDGKVYNSAAIVRPDGDVGVYRKAHVVHWLEGKWGCASPQRSADYSDIFPVWDTEYGRIAVAVCYDRQFPEVARIYMLKGAYLYVDCTAVPDLPRWELEKIFTVQMPGIARTNLIYVASADMVGKETEWGIPYVGHSVITGPNYPAHFHTYAGPASRTKEQLLVATLNRKNLEKFRDKYPISDRRPEDYAVLSKPPHPEVMMPVRK